LNEILLKFDEVNKKVVELESLLRVAEESLRQRALVLPDEAIEQRVLDYLRKHDGEAYPSDIASHLGISENYLMKIFESFERKGKIRKIS
jgi:uncharacterized membrane protein